MSYSATFCISVDRRWGVHKLVINYRWPSTLKFPTPSVVDKNGKVVWTLPLFKTQHAHNSHITASTKAWRKLTSKAYPISSNILLQSDDGLHSLLHVSLGAHLLIFLTLLDSAHRRKRCHDTEFCVHVARNDKVFAKYSTCCSDIVYRHVHVRM